MICYTEILSLEFLENTIRDVFEGVIKENGEHPIIFNIKNKNGNEFIGYTVQDKQKVIGIVFLSPFHSKEAYACTYNFNIYLIKEYRGKGIANELFNIFMKEISKNSAIKNLIITVYNDQSHCINWLINKGFTKVGVLDDIDTNGQYGKKVAFLVKKLY